MLKKSLGHHVVRDHETKKLHEVLNDNNKISTFNSTSSISSKCLWENKVFETVICVEKDGLIEVLGGSDNGEFPYVNQVHPTVKFQNGAPLLTIGSIILEVQGQKIAGYTQRDVIAWLNHCTRNGNPCVIRSVQPGSLTRDLRHYLSTRFPKGGIDHDLQNTIRDNVYLRTVPVTTRPPRQGELNGVDYTFLSHQEFQALQRSGNLLEAGLFEGNHYGTPKPPAHGGELGRGAGAPTLLLSGAHPSSEGKRRRNRSNVEAMAANTIDIPPESNSYGGGPPPPPPQQSSPPDELGPLPPNWEKAYTESGEPYFIDHVAGTSSWLDPRLARVQKRNAEECREDELPFGWERIDDPQYGTYYIDHVNRKTQYENPVVVAKKQLDEPPSPVQVTADLDETSNSTFPRPKKPSELNGSNQKLSENGHIYHPSKRSHSRNGSSSVFTRNPLELKGEFLRTTLVKSSRGLGFTIVGGDDNEDEFLQIKSVVPNGPAWQDSKLRTGDVLVYVNDTCVLGYTHADVVNMFQNIEPGRTVYLEVCRGYPLPFDPNDPNTEIVTTVAVTSDSRSSKSAFGDEFDSRSRNNSNESMNTAKSMPDLSNTERVSQVPRPGSADLLSSENYHDTMDIYPPVKPDYLTIPIVKGNMGFGFTIADSAYGQKVKKILDRKRCQILTEGDILVDINSINVKGMSHTEVVQVLKDCPQGHEAIIMIQRGGLSSPSKSRGSRKDVSPKKPSLVTSAAGLFRSKTPTADMYSSQQKEIVPSRSKTPIVDTRIRSKTPTFSDQQHPVDYPYNNNNGAPFAFPYNNTSLDNNKMNTLPPINGNSFDRSSDKFNMIGYESQGPYNYRRDVYNSYSQPQQSYEKDNSAASFKSVPESYPQYSYFNNNNSQSNGFVDEQSYGYVQYPKDSYDVPRQDSGYSSQAQVPPSRNPFPPYYGHGSSVGYNNNNVAAPDQQYSFGGQPELPPNLQRRKESTSFEHPVPMPRFHQGVSSNAHLGMIHPFEEFTLTLGRQDSGFGFRIVGGTEEGSQVSIGHIVPGGSADLDGRVMSGDEIICIDGQMVLGSSHHHVVELMAAAGAQGRVSITLRRPAYASQPTSDVHNRSMEMPQYPYDVTVTRRETEGFGFVIISSVAKSGSTIGRILVGSPAERCGKLHVGDRILSVNRIDIKTLHHGSIVNLIKESGYEVTLTIGPPRDDASSTTSNSQRAESDMGEEGELYHVELSRGNSGFGFSIRGGKEFHNMPLFVLRIAENGPAAEDGKLKIGDQLMEIKGVSTKEMTHADAIELIRQCGSSVTLLVRRGGKLPPHLDPMSPMNAHNLGSPVGPPPPGTHIRSTATLPSGSPNHYRPHYQSYPQTLVHNGPLRGPMHSSPATQYGPLGQSSPRVPPTETYYWNQDHRPV